MRRKRQIVESYTIKIDIPKESVSEPVNNKEGEKTKDIHLRQLRRKNYRSFRKNGVVGTDGEPNSGTIQIKSSERDQTEGEWRHGERRGRI